MIYAEKEYLLKNNRVCTLRSAAVSDAAVMVEFLQITNEETYFMLRYPEEITLTEEEEITILKNWEVQPNKLLLLALIDGEIAGNCGIAPVAEHLKTKHRGRLGISVRKKYWGIGIGSLLLREILSFAKKDGIEQVELGVYSDNLRAQKLYERFGFTEWGRLPNAYKLKDGGYRDEINMVLRFTEQ